VSGRAPQPVVVDVHDRGAVAGLRGLGAAGLHPAALGRRWTDAGLWSRHAAARAVVAPDDRAAAVLGSALAALAARTGTTVVPYPSTERGVDAVIDAAQERAAVVAPFPIDAVQRLRRKSTLGELAAEGGVAAPVWLSATAAELLAATVPAPCVVKCDRPIGALPTTLVASSTGELRAILRALPADEPLVVQPRLRGPLVCLGIVVGEHGRVVERFQHVTSATWPEAAGSTARARSVAPDEELIARAARVLAAAGYRGIAEMDFLQGPDGLVLVDVNPRYYGSLALALAAGANLPRAWHAVVSDAPLPAPSRYRTGVTYRWLAADWFALARGRPNRLVRRAGRPRTGPMWQADDPFPGALLTGHALAERVAARANRRRPGRPIRRLLG
jgi:predicted ATP-grasp superfamily ATP-dependent carboligase